MIERQQAAFDLETQRSNLKRNRCPSGHGPFKADDDGFHRCLICKVQWQPLSNGHFFVSILRS